MAVWQYRIRTVSNNLNPPPILQYITIARYKMVMHCLLCFRSSIVKTPQTIPFKSKEHSNESESSRLWSDWAYALGAHAILLVLSCAGSIIRHIHSRDPDKMHIHTVWSAHSLSHWFLKDSMSSGINRERRLISAFFVYTAWSWSLIFVYRSIGLYYFISRQQRSSETVWMGMIWVWGLVFALRHVFAYCSQWMKQLSTQMIFCVPSDTTSGACAQQLIFVSSYHVVTWHRNYAHLK